MKSNQGGLGRFRRRKTRARRRNFIVVILLVVAGFWWLVLRNPETTPKATIAADGLNQRQAERSPIASAGRGASVPEPTRATTPDVRTKQRTAPLTGAAGARANKPISVITMGERTGSDERVGASISDAIDLARQQQGAGATGGESLDSTTGAPGVAGGDSGDAAPAIASMISRAESAVTRNRLVEARTLYNAALLDRQTDSRTRAMLRRRITAINDTLLFGPTISEDDPYTSRYEIQPGDALSKLPRKLGLNVNWRFLQRINGISDPKRIRVGQRIKTVAGPFHAVITKSAYRLDLFMGDSSELMYVASFPVGLGADDSTPIGSWVVRKDSKLVNPRWVNPRTGEVFAPNNPLNPIGERWIGIEGVDDRTRPLEGFGLHGTVDPGSIGTQASMGCVRLGDDDVELVYELLIEGVSRVEIRP